MTTIHFIQHNGSTATVEAQDGLSVMQAAMAHRIPNIVADCGGACACATCHGYIDEPWQARVPAASADELDMIDAACLHAEPSSRLTCQIKVTPALDGLTVRLPPSQG
jgi:2Fe-2S ferredoxin